VSRSTGKTVPAIVLIGVLVGAGWFAYTHLTHAAAVAATATAAAPATHPAAAPATGTASGLRSESSPGTVANDIALQPGQCHVREVNRQAGLVLPDSACTPGAIDPAVTQANIQQTICKTGYTGDIRPSASITKKFKQQSLAEYGLIYNHSTEYDHLVSLQLGGTNAVTNLWPEPNRSGAPGTTNPKDTVENTLHRAVCSQKITLAQAQQAIATDWTSADAKLGLK
jgi:hypothetical protein